MTARNARVTPARTEHAAARVAPAAHDRTWIRAPPRAYPHGVTEEAAGSPRPRPLWRCPRRPRCPRCPRCGRTFANRNQSHACGALGDLERHVAGTEPGVRRTFDRVLAAVRRLGPVEVLPERTRIALHARMRFAAFSPRTRWLAGHLVLARRVDRPRFRRTETSSPRTVLHAFRLTSPDEVDGAFLGWLAEAYAVGQQCHLTR